MKASVIKKSAVKKSAINSNSRRAKKSAAKSVVAVRKPRKFKSLLGTGKGEFTILGDIVGPSGLNW